MLTAEMTAERCLHILLVVVVVVVLVDLQAPAVVPRVRHHHHHLHHHHVLSAFRVAFEEIDHQKQISRYVSMIVSAT